VRRGLCSERQFDSVRILPPLVPAQAGTQVRLRVRFWIPAFAGMGGGDVSPIPAQKSRSA
jgi:hypothetical protein